MHISFSRTRDSGMDHTTKELITMRKVLDESSAEFDAPQPGKRLSVKLMSPEDRSVKFSLDIYEGTHSSLVSLEISEERKTTMQTRAFSQPLVRIDLDAHASHTNPDGTVIHGPHVHIADDEHGDKVAYPLDSDEARAVTGAADDVPAVFESFLSYCNVEYEFRINWNLGV